ncbi:hypothetical protein, partial [Desulfobacter vibrioformis]|uniref:hypothetical protein n=1 Tax=Desulfobacter vibrioformis TaxID=34031 RepID=UPI00055896E8
MKQLLYFLIGVLISACLMLPYAHAECTDLTDFKTNYEYYKHYEGNESVFHYSHYSNSGAAQLAITSAHDSIGGSIEALTGVTNGIILGIGYWTFSYGDVSSSPAIYHFYCYTYGDFTPCDQVPPDSDGDGLPDDCDIYPNDPVAYSVKMTAYQTVDDTSSGDKSYICYVTDRGDNYCTGTDGALNGATDFVIAEGTWIAGSDICTSGSSPSVSKAPDSVVPQPSKPAAPSSPGADGDSDSDLFKKIAGNSDSTNKNLDYISDLLGITNGLLGKLNNKSGSSGNGAVVYAPTAAEIGEAVEDSLIDPTQTIDTTITDNIPDLDETETLTAIKTKYSDRYDLFLDTLKESDLFTLPFAIFTGPSGSGSSIQTVEIG